MMIPLTLIHLQELLDVALGILGSRSAGDVQVTRGDHVPISPSITDAPDPRGGLGVSRSSLCEHRLEQGSQGGVSNNNLDEDEQNHSLVLSMTTDATLEPSSSRDSDYTHLRNELLLLREKHSTLQGVLRDTQQRLAQKDVQLDQVREKNRKLESDLRDMHHLAEERALEVKSLETFLTKTDRWAGAQIVQTVKDLNSEILQFSAAASESFALEHREVRNTSSRQKSVDWLKARHGTALCRCLERRDHSQDPTLLQYALQASISHSLCRALSSFVFGSPSKLDQILMKIYLHMHITEPQATSARWRALTHSHIRALTPNIDKASIAESIEANVTGIAHVLCVGGFGEVEELNHKVQARFMTQLRRIVDMASKTALVIREGTMSTDFQPYFVDASKEFDPNSMHNIYEGYGPSRGIVLCTAEMGLRCYTNTGREGRNHGENEIEKLVVLKPKVVLESVVQILDRDQ